MLKRLLKALLPDFMISAYHYVLALFSTMRYRHPSEKMIVIGVTGTSGKSTTCFLLARALEAAGAKVGMASTILFKVADQETLNDKKMTMVGRFQLQKLLREMVQAGCTHAIVETTSEGIKQFRHLGIHYDVCVFTNLYPEHIESHGSFTNYKAAKLELFRKLECDPHKTIGDRRIDKGIVVNIEDEHAKDVLAFDVDQKVEVRPSKQKLDLKLLGDHNQINAQLALATGSFLGFDEDQLTDALARVEALPGRLERIDEGQDFTVIVDYAFEPRALEKLYAAVKPLKPNRIIQVTGATGGGRDADKRPVVGRMVAEHAAVTIVTNEDPYDEDPQKIIDEVASGAEPLAANGKTELLKIPDRGAAIRRAVSLARTGDLVLVTGKGSEGAMAVAGGRLLPWDDREVVREALHNR